MTLDSINKRIKKEGETAELLYLLSKYYFKENDFQTAAEYAQKAINIDKNYGDAYCVIAVFLYNSGKRNEAKEYFSKAEQLGCKFAILYYLTADLLFIEGNFKSAYKYASKGIKANKKDYHSYQAKGVILY